MEQIQIPQFKNEEEKKKFFEAVQVTENAQDENPKGKYKSGFIKKFFEKATKSGEYKPHIDTTIKETKEHLDDIYKQIEEDKKATHNLSEEHTDPEAYRIKKEKELE